MSKPVNSVASVQSIFIDLKRLDQNQSLRDLSVLRTTSSKVYGDQSNLDTLQDELITEKNDRKKLNLRLKEIHLRGHLDKFKNFVSSRRNEYARDRDWQSRQDERLIDGLSELTAGKDGLIEHERALLSLVSQPVHGTRDLLMAQSLGAQVLKDQQQRNLTRVNQNIESHNQQQAGRISAQDKAMGRLKTFGSLFSVLQATVMQAVHVFSQTLAPILSTAIASGAQMFLTGLSQGVSGRYASQLNAYSQSIGDWERSRQANQNQFQQAQQHFISEQEKLKRNQDIIEASLNGL